jgi:hypothetical protein
MLMAENLQNMMYAFIANVIDCCDETVIKSFINTTSNTVNVDSLLSNSLTKTSVIFQIIWNKLFKSTYPTKKDFAELLTRLGGLQTVMKSSQDINTKAILQACLDHEAFTILKMTSNMTQALQALEKQIPQLNPANLYEFMVAKWMHRFGATITPESNNIIRTFVHLQNAYIPELQYEYDDFKPVIEPFTQDEMKWMNEHERAQYTLYRNNRLLLHVVAHCIIVCHKVPPPKYFWEAIQQEKQHVSVVYVGACDNCEIGMLDHMMSKAIYEMLPKIARNVICINTPTDWQHPIDVLHKQNAIYVNLDEPCSYLKGEKLPDQFQFCLTNMFEYTDPLRHIYALPSGITAFRKQVFKWYISHSCPFKTSNVKDNIMLYAHFMSCYIHRIGKSISHIGKSNMCNSNPENVIVSIDTRFNILTLYAVLASYARIYDKHDWKMCIITSKSAIPQYKKALNKIIGVASTPIDIVDNSIINRAHYDLFHMELYNSILKDESIWELLQSLGFKRCLVVQDDGMLINDNNELSKYFDYDYVGAPWIDAIGNEYIKQHVNSEMVGNGGFSLRNIEKMITICKEFKQEKKHLFYHNINEIPEDVYFVQCLKKLGASLPPNVVAKNFAIEQVFEQSCSPLGYHKFWIYHPASIAWRVFLDFLS